MRFVTISSDVDLLTNTAAAGLSQLKKSRVIKSNEAFRCVTWPF
jgi:hypothetical protein